MKLEQWSWLEGGRLTALVGHFGTGKTEVSVNMALALTELGHRVTLVDLDVVDPYFRSRECAALFAQRGVGLITSSQACVNADVPSLPAQVQALFEPDSGFGDQGVMSIGKNLAEAGVEEGLEVPGFPPTGRKCGAAPPTARSSSPTSALVPLWWTTPPRLWS